MPYRPRRLRAVSVAAVAVLLLTAACSGGGDDQASDGATAGPAPSTSATVPAGMAEFYAQKLKWSGCGQSFQCTRVEVPVDYAKPSGDTIELSVVRLRASRSDGRVGSLVVNPGGPGGSGVGYARAAETVISETVRRRFDVVGFDPRGVGESAPLKCLDDAETDDLIGSDPTPDDATEVKATVGLYKQVASRCKAAGGELLAHVDTRSAARDMDVLRAALGDRKLNYLGKSYGTFLGATYAEEFPGNVGRFVLDGALDPALSADEINLGQAKGFEQATRAFVADCADQADCPLGSDVDGGMQRLRDLLKSLDANPLPTNDPARRLTEGRGSLGVATAMYDEQYWPLLRKGLQDAFAGEGSQLLTLADAYTDRQADGTFASNQNTVIYAVNCLDRPDDGGLAGVEKAVGRYTEQAPTWGAFLAWSQLPCAYWPVKSKQQPAALRAEGSGPIVVVGTTRDPATPYVWAQGLAGELSDGHLITYEGDGHTAYRRGNRCVDKAVDAYFLRGTVPEDGLRCK